MDKAEITEYLKENLSIRVSKYPSASGEVTICVELSLEGEMFTEGFNHISKEDFE